MTKDSQLRAFPLLSDLSAPELAELQSLLVRRESARGEVIFRQHDAAEGFYLIVKGLVKLSRIGRDGREVTLNILGEGSFFGEMSLLDGQPRAATATSMAASRLLFLEREAFRRFVLTRPPVMTRMLRELSLRLRAANQTIENLALGTARERLLHLLGHLGRRPPTQDSRGTTVRSPTHQEIAEMIGASRETVTRLLAELEADGLIAVRERRISLLPPFFAAEAGRG